MPAVPCVTLLSSFPPPSFFPCSPSSTLFSLPSSPPPLLLQLSLPPPAAMPPRPAASWLRVLAVNRPTRVRAHAAVHRRDPRSWFGRSQRAATEITEQCADALPQPHTLIFQTGWMTAMTAPRVIENQVQVFDVVAMFRVPYSRSIHRLCSHCRIDTPCRHVTASTHRVGTQNSQRHRQAQGIPLPLPLSAGGCPPRLGRLPPPLRRLQHPPPPPPAAASTQCSRCSFRD
eukprot:COSAG03_NODE_6_length_26200_cov_62.015517_5_plen_230_part_00